MMHRSGRSSWILWSLLLVSAACSRRNLDLGDGPGKIGPGDGGPVTATDGGPADGPGVSVADGPPPPPPPVDGRPMESACVTAAIPLPWTKTGTASLHLPVAASN